MGWKCSAASRKSEPISLLFAVHHSSGRDVKKASLWYFFVCWSSLLHTSLPYVYDSTWSSPCLSLYSQPSDSHPAQQHAKLIPHPGLLCLRTLFLEFFSPGSLHGYLLSTQHKSFYLKDVSPDLCLWGFFPYSQPLVDHCHLPNIIWNHLIYIIMFSFMLIGCHLQLDCKFYECRSLSVLFTIPSWHLENFTINSINISFGKSILSENRLRALAKVQ